MFLWMEALCKLPIFAVQRVSGRWLIRAPTVSDPLLPAAPVVAAIDEPQWRPPRGRMLGLVSRFEVCAGAEALLPN